MYGMSNLFAVLSTLNGLELDGYRAFVVASRRGCIHPEKVESRVRASS